MAQDITQYSSAAEIIAHIERFIVTDADGSLRVDQPAMRAWLVEQYGYSNQSMSPHQFLLSSAEYTVSRLAAVINRENWQKDPAWPNIGGNKSEEIRTRLHQIQQEFHAAASALEAPYQQVSAALPAKIKAIFNSAVSPGYPTGVDRIIESRTYVYTYVTDRGEESAPSPASPIIDLDQNDTASVTIPAPPPGRHIAAARLYRSATGTQSSAFQLQGEHQIAGAPVVVTDATPQARLQEACPTFGWLAPPADLQGLIALPNGIALGFAGRTLHACEPYHPYAWPAKYDKPLAYPIVGIVAVGQSAFVGTTDRPYLVSGSDSASLSEELIPFKAPCASRRSMVAVGGSVFYASEDGLALYEAGRVEIISKLLMDRATWQSYNPATMRAAAFDGMVFLFYDRGDAGRGCLVFDYEQKMLTELEQGADAVFSNAHGIYILEGAAIKDVLAGFDGSRAAAWHSKTFRLPTPQSFGWLQVDFADIGNATVRVHADGELFYTAIVGNSRPVRLPPGKFTDWRIDIESAAPINGIVLASTTDELKAAP